MVYIRGSWLTAASEGAKLHHLRPAATAAAAARLWRGKYSIPLNATVYGNFGRISKFDGETFRLWCNILARVNGSHLVLVQLLSAGATSHVVSKNIWRAWAACGLPIERLHLVPPFEHGELLVAASALLDVALDTAMYGGGMTSHEMLSAGVPLVHYSSGPKVRDTESPNYIVVGHTPTHTYTDTHTHIHTHHALIIEDCRTQRSSGQHKCVGNAKLCTRTPASTHTPCALQEGVFAQV